MGQKQDWVHPLWSPVEASRETEKVHAYDPWAVHLQNQQICQDVGSGPGGFVALRWLATNAGLHWAPHSSGRGNSRQGRTRIHAMRNPSLIPSSPALVIAAMRPAGPNVMKRIGAEPGAPVAACPSLVRMDSQPCLITPSPQTPLAPYSVTGRSFLPSGP